MAITVCLALALLSIGVVVYPFWRRLRTTGLARSKGSLLSGPIKVTCLRPLGGSRTPETDSPDFGQLDADLDSVYDAIRTLRLEHQLGNIPLGLYREQLQDYRLQAAMILRDQAEAAARDDEWLLEQDVNLARAALDYANGSVVSCPNCAAAAAPGRTQCPECSADLPAKSVIPPEHPEA